MKKKIAIFIVTTLVLIVGAIVAVYFLVLRDVRQIQVINQDDVIGSLDVDYFSVIEVEDSQEEIVEVIKIERRKGDIEVEFNDDDYILMYWDIEQNGLNYKVKPIVEKMGKYQADFISNEDSKLLYNDKDFSHLTLPQRGGRVGQSLPKVSLGNELLGYDWYFKDETSLDFVRLDLCNEDETLENSCKVKSDITYKVETYVDENRNNIDDSAETFVVNYFTNNGSIIPQETYVYGDNVKLHNLVKNDMIFTNWYSDEGFTEIVTENTLVKSDLNLYARFVSYTELMNESVEHPIYRKDLSLQLQEILDKKNEVIDIEFNTKVDIKNEEKRIDEERQLAERGTVEKEVERYVYHNVNHNKIFLVTYLDMNGNYKFSMAIPYGQFVRIYDNRGGLLSEYSIKKNTTIVLNGNEYQTNYNKLHESVFVKIQEK